MEHIEHPDLETWEERRYWFEALDRERSQRGAATVLSEQGCALMIDLQATFCTGAWAATVILAAVIVDSQARFTPQDPGLRDELDWLRRTRNALLHESPQAPIFTLEDQWTRRREWERAAKRAVGVAIEALYPDKTFERTSQEGRSGSR